MKLKSKNTFIKYLFLIEFGSLMIVSSIFAQADLFKEADLATVTLSDNQATILRMIQQDTSTIAVRVVEVDTDLLGQAQTINLNLTPARELVVATSRLDRREMQDFDWYGNTPADSDYALISVYRDAVAGFVIVEGEVYNIRPLGNGLQALIHADPTKGPRCGNMPTYGGNLRNISISQNAVSIAGDVQLLNATNTIIKALVAYTPTAKDEAGGQNGIEAVINNAYAAANASYDNSNIPIDLQVAHKVEVDYTENSLLGPLFVDECMDERRRRVALIDFQNPSDGLMDDVHDYRGAYGGDVAVLFAGFAIGDPGQAFEIGATFSQAFCIVRQDKAASGGFWSFAHEIGHRQGARHDELNDDCNIPFSYGHAFIFEDLAGNDKMTIMGVDEIPTRIQYWSSPGISYQGTTIGDAECCDNASVLTETASTVANFFKEESGTISNKTISGNVSFNNVTISGTVTIGSSAKIYIRGGSTDLTVNSGATLIINQGAVLKFPAYVGLVVDGTLEVNGTQSIPVTFDGLSYNTNWWDGIRINSASGSSSRISFATIKNAALGVFASGSSPTIEDTKINSGAYGIYMSGGAPTLWRNTISYNDLSGVRCLSSSAPSFGTDPDYGDNVIRRNNKHAVDASYNCNVFLGLAASPPIGGRNSIYENYDASGYQVKLTNGSTSLAEFNWWGSDPPNTNIFNDLSAIDYSPWWTGSDPHADRPLTKILAGGDTGPSEVSDRSASSSKVLSDKFWRAFLYFHQAQYDSAIQICSDIITSSPLSQEAQSALSILRLAYAESGKMGFETVVANLIALYPAQQIAGVARLNWAWYEVRKRRLSSALAQLEQNISAFPNSSVERISIFQKGLHYLFELEDHQAAESAFAELQQKYPADALAIDSQVLLGLYDHSFMAQSAGSNEESQSDQILIYNSPNPFNPSTEIRYRIHQEGRVALRVFNTLGERVRVLVDAFKPAGEYSIVWDGNNTHGIPVSSGVYLYQITFAPEERGAEVKIQSGKMSLVR